LSHWLSGRSVPCGLSLAHFLPWSIRTRPCVLQLSLETPPQKLFPSAHFKSAGYFISRAWYPKFWPPISINNFLLFLSGLNFILNILSIHSLSVNNGKPWAYIYNLYNKKQGFTMLSITNKLTHKLDETSRHTENCSIKFLQLEENQEDGVPNIEGNKCWGCDLIQ
jgi:hypothetical protein